MTLATKIFLTALPVLICVLLTGTLDAQSNFVQNLKGISEKLINDSALIKINDKDASYADLLKIPDGSLLKAEVYPRKKAVKIVGKEQGKNGLVLITLRKGEIFKADINGKHGNYIVKDNGDSVYCQHISVATLGGDTTQNNWYLFISRHLQAGLAAENGSPPGIFNVYFSFEIAKNGNVTNLKILDDPGYGCGDEVKRLMTESPVWSTAMCENEVITWLHKQRITFIVYPE